jgi:hypothetical protein
MARIGPPAIDTSWRYALLAGLASLPFALYNYWSSGGDVEISALFTIALVAGYLAKRRGLESTPVGFRAGLVGAIPLLWQLADVARAIPGFDQPVWFGALQFGMLVGLTGLLLILVAGLSGLSARVGGWLAEQVGHPRRSAPA